MTLELNAVHEGDCLELMKEIPTGSVNMILCDLPYGTTSCKWDTVIPFEPLWAEYERIIKVNGAIVLTAQTPFDKVLGASNIKLLRYEWIWQKDRPTGHLNAKKMPMKAHENILVFYKKLPTYNPQMTHGHKPMNSSLGKGKISENYRDGLKKVITNDKSTIRYPQSIQKFNKPNSNGHVFHPTQKPVPLFEYLIKTYTNEGDVVLDNCVGSGTTALAAINTGRNFIAIEKDAKYVDIARQRISAAIQAEDNGNADVTYQAEELFGIFNTPEDNGNFVLNKMEVDGSQC